MELAQQSDKLKEGTVTRGGLVELAAAPRGKVSQQIRDSVHELQ